MISTREADGLIAGAFGDLPVPGDELVALEHSLGRVLATDVVADRDQPPFDRVAMDGIAVVASDEVPGPCFQVDGRLAPGQAWPDGDPHPGPERAIEVMTGAALPPPWNAVVPWEDLQRREGTSFELHPGVRPSRGLNIHRRASDYRQGERLVPAGTPITAPHLHVLASVGQARVRVLARPRIAVLATGDELVPIETSPGPQQIRMSNRAALVACLQRAALPIACSLHSADSRPSLEKALATALAESDVVFVSGAVSKGSKDFVPDVLPSLGCTRIFHGVAHKPGKPLWFGRSPGRGVVFALPGNPVSALVCFARYALPHLRRWGRPRVDAAASPLVLPILDAVEVQAKVALLLPAEIVPGPEGGSGLRLRKGSGSGNYLGLLPSDGIAEVPTGNVPLPRGTPLPFYPWP